MFFSSPPNFDDILAEVASLEEEVNTRLASSSDSSKRKDQIETEC